MVINGNLAINTPQDIVEGSVTILGQTIKTLLTAHPLQNFWSWDDDRLTAELYSCTLYDIGNSKSGDVSR